MRILRRMFRVTKRERRRNEIIGETTNESDNLKKSKGKEVEVVWACFFCFCFCRILYSLMVESYYSCMRGMISRERNSAVKEKQRVGKHC